MNIQSNYTYIPKASTIYLKNNKVTTFVPKFKGLDNDTVQFSRKYLTSPYARIEGACNLYLIKEQIDKDVYMKVPAMRGKTFTKEDYKSLNKEEKEYLREIIDTPYYDKPNSVPRGASSTIRQDRDFFIKLSKKMKKKLDKDYPEGWSFISLGGSPSVFAQTLSYMGEDSKELPFSYACTLYNNFENVDMDKYLDDVGITREYLNDGKKKILTDYVWSGTSLNKMENIMYENDRYNENVEVRKLQDLLPDDLPSHEDRKIKLFFFEQEHIKAYSSCPSMHKPDMYDVERMNKEYQWSMSAKLMNFALIDYFERKNFIKNTITDLFK